jgi:surface antigen
MVAADEWFGGHGVDVHSNGCNGCGSTVWSTYGWEWQCVELFERFINAEGWYHGIAGSGIQGASELFNAVSSSAFDKHPNGSGYIPVPGDAVIFGGGLGHVAIVDQVSSGQITVVEENASATGRSVLTMSGSTINGVYAHSVIGVLHAKANTSPPTEGGGPGGGGGSPASRPAAVANSAGLMNVFYRDASGNLVNEYWTPSGGWVKQVLSSGVTGNPAVIARTPESMDVFYRDTGGHLINEYWSVASGWHSQVLASGMAGDPAAIANSPTWMNVFYDDTGGHLINEYWTASGGWVGQSLASGVSGNVAAITRTPESMDVFYRDTGGHLTNEYWSASGGWAGQSLASGMAGDPAAIANSPTWMNVFYDDTGGHLINEYWTASGGWVGQTLP